MTANNAEQDIISSEERKVEILINQGSSYLAERQVRGLGQVASKDQPYDTVRMPREDTTRCFSDIATSHPKAEASDAIAGITSKEADARFEPVHMYLFLKRIQNDYIDGKKSYAESVVRLVERLGKDATPEVRYIVLGVKDDIHSIGELKPEYFIDELQPGPIDQSA